MNTARDEGSLNVVTVSHAVSHAGSKSDDILKGSAKLNAEYIGTRIDAENRTHEYRLDILSHLSVIGCRDNSSR